MERLVAYFEKTWVGAQKYQSSVRRKPLISHQVFSNYEAIIQNRPTTSNAAEGYNGALKRCLAHNASVWALIDLFRAEEALALKKLAEAAIGVAGPSTSRSSERVLRHSELKALVLNYTNMPLRDYMTLLLHFHQR